MSFSIQNPHRPIEIDYDNLPFGEFILFVLRLTATGLILEILVVPFL